MKKVLLVLTAASMLQGCAYMGFDDYERNDEWSYTPWYERDASNSNKKKAVVTEEYFKTRLLETAEMVSRSLRELAEIEQSIRVKRHLEVAKASEGVNDPRLLQMVTISSLNGTEVTIESILDRLSTVAEYEFKVFNKRPLVPITVSIPKGQYRLVDLLKNVGMQAGSNGTVYVKDGLVELVYASQQY